MTQIEQIKAEIERRIKALEKTFPNTYYEGEVCGLKRLLSFIESLEKESKDNKTEAYMKGFCDGVEAERESADVAPKIKGWVARDSVDKRLTLFMAKPYRGAEYWIAQAISSLPIESYPYLKWEDEPIEIELTISRVIK